MVRLVGAAYLLGLLLAGCAAPIYYCTEVNLHLKDGRDVDALECLPRWRQLPKRLEPAKSASAPEFFAGLRRAPRVSAGLHATCLSG